jgi:hypothetical protein
METFREMFGGPMGGDQRNMRGSSNSVRDSEKFNGKSIDFPLGKEAELEYLRSMADEFDIELEFLYFDSYRITGKKAQIKKFLKQAGYKPREYNEYF